MTNQATGVIFFVLHALDHHLVDLFGLAARHAERFPVGRFQMFGQEDYLTDMRGVVSQLAIDRLEDGVRLMADYHGLHHVFGTQRLNRVEDMSPTPLPPLYHFGAFSIRVNDELLVAAPVRFLAVA